jgi:hypothetical protein
MLSRSFNSAGMSQRSAAQRRLRRSAAARRLFCSTNGCTTYMLPDTSGNTATCPICGAQRHIGAARPEIQLARVH